MNIKSKDKENFILSLLILFNISFSIIKCSVINSNTIGNSKTNLTIQLLDPTKNIPKDSLIIITVPKQYSAINLHNNLPYSGYDIQNNFCPFSCSSITISYYSYTFVLTGAFTNNTSLIISYTIFNIKNPQYATNTGDFQVEIKSSDFLTTYYSQMSPGISITAANFQSISATLSSPLIWSTSKINFNIFLTIKTDNLKIIFPSKWQNETILDSTLTSSVSLSSASHQISFNKVGLNIDIDFPQILSNQTLLLSFSSIYTPSSLISLGQIKIMAYNNLGQTIRESSYYIPNTQLKAQVLRLPESKVEYDENNNKIYVSFKFKFPKNYMLNDKVIINFPSQLLISSAVSDYQISYSKVVQTDLTPSIFINNNSIVIISISGTLFQEQVTIKMRNSWPRTQIQTSNFSVSTYRLTGSSYSQMQNIQCCALRTKQKQTLNVNLLLSNQQRLKSNVQYQFQLTHKHSQLTTSDKINIQFPNFYSLDIANQAAVCSSTIINIASNSSNINSLYNCILSKNILTFSNIVLSNQNPTLISLKFNLSNPSNSHSQNFLIWSENNAGYKIQSNNLIGVNIYAASINSLSISSGSLITNQKTYYVFQIDSIGLISKNTFIKIILPSQIKISQNSFSCQVDNVQKYCSYDKSSHNVQILISKNLISTNFTIKLSNLINPQTLATSSNFQIKILNAQGEIIESSQLLSTGKNIKMKNLGSFLLNKFQTTDYQVNTITSLKINLVLPYLLQTSSQYLIVLIINPFSQISLNSSNSILKINSIQNTFNTTTSGSSMIISIKYVSISITNIMELQFSNTKLYKDNITFNITLSKNISNIFYDSLSLSSVQTLQNNLNQYLISDYVVSQSSYYLNQLTGWLYLKINNIPNNLIFSYCQVYIPSNYDSPSNIYVYNSTSNITSINFTISGLLNPIIITQEPFIFILYGSNNQIVGISNPIPNNISQYYDLKCKFPCRNCKSLNQSSVCVDCYQLTSNKMKYFRKTSGVYGQCTDQCIKGEYLNLSIKSCEPCNSSCQSCLIQVNSSSSGDPNTCLTCPSGKYLLNNICYNSCPNGYYSNSQICLKCIDNCVKCNSLTVCLQCQSSYVFYSGFCLKVCPLKTYTSLINNTTSFYKCENCPSNCLQCTSSNKCLICDNGYYLYNQTCLSSCPIISSKQLYPNLNKSCSVCECLTCNLTSYNCTSCVTGLFLDNVKHICVTTCPEGYYNSINVCMKCAINCLSCTTLNNCILCKQPYILYRKNNTYSECVSNCSSTTNTSLMTIINIISPTTKILQCVSCTLNCKTCYLSSSFCISCNSNYILFKNQCINKCPSNYFNLSNQCLKCPLECLNCQISNPYNCSECIDGYYLYNNSCYKQCPVRTYRQINLKKCLGCSLLCQTCLNATHCTSCKAGYFLFTDNLCYNSCPTTPVYYYEYKSQCIKCQPQCTTCLSSPIQCSSCSSIIYYQNQDTKQCSTQCAVNYFKETLNNKNKCVKCKYPCLQCDTNYDSCSKCYPNSQLKYLYEGSCLKECPDRFYSLTNYSCTQCPYPCMTCTQNKCLTCQIFAYMYKNTCVLDCKTTLDMIYSKQNYCTNCVSVPFCMSCTQTSNKNQCSQCINPYVLFAGQCLNNCPEYFQIKSQDQRICIQSVSYLKQQERIIEQNKPKFPFSFLITFLIISMILYPLSKIFYSYTYHIGYCIFFLNIMDYLLVYIWFLDIYSRYTGQFVDHDQKQIPLILVVCGLMFNIVILGWISFGYTLKFLYLKDVRYLQWKSEHKINFILFCILFIIFGPKTHKLYYSKLLGYHQFAYRIISVQKFYLEDRINFISSFGDILIVTGFIIISMNIFIQYSILYVSNFQILIIKILMWILLSIDSKKPDRGFFYGDQKIAEQQIQKQLQQQNQKLLNRVDIDHLVKMIRRKSMGQLNRQKQFNDIEKMQLISVYNPDEYQGIPKIPIRQIAKKIQKGYFRKRNKISAEQKLKRYADSIKPRPLKNKQEQYLRGLIYWKPPKKIKQTKKIKVQPLSQESMLKILQDKQLQYKDQLQQIQQIVFKEQQQNLNFKTGQFFFKNKNKNNQSYEQFQESIQSFQDFQGIQFQNSSSLINPVSQISSFDLMNLNYAKKKHLPRKQRKKNFDENQMRILYHEPSKKRKSRLQ